jgi:hypothetical protein
VALGYKANHQKDLQPHQQLELHVKLTHDFYQPRLPQYDQIPVSFKIITFLASAAAAILARSNKIAIGVMIVASSSSLESFQQHE